MDLRPEPMVLAVPAVAPKRYYPFMICDAILQLWLLGTRATGSEAGDYMVVGAGLEGRDTPPGIKKGVPLEHAIFVGGESNPAFRSGRSRSRSRRSRPIQGAAASAI